MYAVDLSPYDHGTGTEYTPTLTIGWLDKQHPFTTGALPTSILDRLWVFCGAWVHLSLGFHHCDFCDASTSFGGIPASRNGKTLTLGSAEIRVIGENVVFAAPDMIYHYMVDHHYVPPSVFLTALMTSPLPDEPRYQELATRYRWD
jgi:hypothetical protein